MLLLKNLLFIVVVPGTVGVYVPLLLARGRPLVNGPLRVAGITLLAVGAAVVLWCIWDFATYGRGTPAPIDAPKRLVVRGLYRRVRNPMYVGVLTALLGWALLFRSSAILLYALLIAAWFHLFVVLYEERRLAGRFGQEYEDYRARVPRWLPRLGRR